MARIARVVAAGLPHHVTQRGNRRQTTFFTEDDYRFYLDQLAQWCDCHDVLIWSYCLMPNHVHLIAVPREEDGLKLAIGETHRRYSRRINFRMGWRGRLWQGRFSSRAMDECYLLATARYVERNPVASGIVSSPGEYPWSSARHYLGQHVDPLIRKSPLSAMVDDWQTFLAGEVDAESRAAIDRTERFRQCGFRCHPGRDSWPRIAEAKARAQDWRELKCGVPGIRPEFGPAATRGTGVAKPCLCTVLLRERMSRFLRVSTFNYPEQPDILEIIEGLLWQAARRRTNDSPWQVGRKKTFFKASAKRILPHGSPLLSCGAFFAASLAIRALL